MLNSDVIYNSLAAPVYSLEATGGLVGEEGAGRREVKLSIYHLGYGSPQELGVMMEELKYWSEQLEANLGVKS